MGARDIQVNGIVQGVGFRPFVARLAHELGIAGWVANDVDGVRIHAEHPQAGHLDEFENRLQEELPQAAHVISFSSKDGVVKDYSDFSIRHSRASGTRDTLVSPDLATCPDCVAELFDENDPRCHYPFINCTNCGPRFTIIEELPYDRAVTSMRRFPMCERCQGEYDDEADRRYHAQPNACFECGPRLWWWDTNDNWRGETPLVETVLTPRGVSPRQSPSEAVLAGNFVETVLTPREEHPEEQTSEAVLTGDVKFDAEGALMLERKHLTREESDALISRCAAVLSAGGIVAIKGLGGWHLSCNALDEAAVATLRERKRRPTKPLAIMVRDTQAAQRICKVSAAEKKLLESRARPIVLLQRLEQTELAHGIAGDLPEVGVMLPATPVQHLLMQAVSCPLVMTSGNRSGEPIVARDEDAFEALGHIADAFLGNNRAIVARYDDSVVRVLEDGSEQMVRRARGYAPMPLFIDGPLVDDEALGCVFCAGPEQKATFSFLQGRRVYLSQHQGDLEHLGAWRAWDESRQQYARLFDLSPTTLVADLHPEYLASKWARKTSGEKELRLIEVQHHHAHIASVLGENGIDEEVIGVALDGTGYGSDGTIWGGEILIATRRDFVRFWHVPTFRLPGGAAAIKEPSRTAFAVLKAANASDDPFWEPFKQEAGRWKRFAEAVDGAEILDAMVEKGLNSPVCSSMGRLFDAVAALLGVCTQPAYDGEAACLLEAAARRELAEQGSDVGSWTRSNMLAPPDGSPLTALSFHRHVIQTIIEQCERAREVHRIDKVALSGGVFVNRLVSQGLAEGLRRHGFTVYVNRELPPNDGCIAYGQAIVARAQFLEE